MKKSKETFKIYEQEIKSMNQKILDLQRIKKELLTGSVGGSAKKNKKNKGNMETEGQSTADLLDQKGQKILEEWKIDKENLNKEKEDLMKQCQELQVVVKACKDKLAAGEK